MGKPRKGSKDKLRNNPAFGKTPAFVPGGSDFDFLAGAAGNLVVTAALSKCTLSEKMLIAALIPMFLKIIRSVPTEDQKAAIEKLWPSPKEVDEVLSTIERTEPPQAESDQTPKDH